jgi:hypothetical protein
MGVSQIEIARCRQTRGDRHAFGFADQAMLARTEFKRTQYPKRSQFLAGHPHHIERQNG